MPSVRNQCGLEVRSLKSKYLEKERVCSRKNILKKLGRIDIGGDYGAMTVFFPEEPTASWGTHKETDGMRLWDDTFVISVRWG